PVEIPFQAKVSNFVNLIGLVDVPVTFDTSSDGVNFTTTVISVRNEGNKGSISIPVVFEGDLAHVVGCHVKKNDCVFVSGQLSLDTKGLFDESFGKLHLVAENINFAEENEKAPRGNGSPTVEKGAQKKAAGGGYTKKPTAEETLALWKDLTKNSLQWWDFRSHKANKLVKDRYPDFKQKVTNAALWLDAAPGWVLPGLAKLEFDVMEIHPKKPYPGGERSDKTKAEVNVTYTWKSLLTNPDEWQDYRANKKNPKFPDFKHKETGEPIWLDKVPSWALDKLPPV
ncbi:hypothetical protein M569_13009, partial [Genlisea aurea]